MRLFLSLAMGFCLLLSNLSADPTNEFSAGWSKGSKSETVTKKTGARKSAFRQGGCQTCTTCCRPVVDATAIFASAVQSGAVDVTSDPQTVQFLANLPSSGINTPLSSGIILGSSLGSTSIDTFTVTKDGDYSIIVNTKAKLLLTGEVGAFTTATKTVEIRILVDNVVKVSTAVPTVAFALCTSCNAGTPAFVSPYVTPSITRILSLTADQVVTIEVVVLPTADEGVPSEVQVTDTFFTVEEVPVVTCAMSEPVCD